MRFPPMIQLETPRLILRKPRASDLGNYHKQLTSDPEVARYMLWQPNSDIAHTALIFEKRLAECAAGTAFHWAITRKGEDSLIGILSLLRFQEDGSCSFAYMLGQEFWGQGYGTEALTAVLGFAFDTIGVTSVAADHMAENPASGAVMAKAGMHRTGFFPGKYEKDGVPHDAIQYSMTKAQWERLP